MDLKERIKLYLKTRDEPVSRNELLSVASGAGASRDDIYKICEAFQNSASLDDVNIGTWWGVKNQAVMNSRELKTLWLRFYPMSDKDKKQLKENIEWFDTLN